MCMHGYIGVVVINSTESLWYGEYVVDKPNQLALYMYEYVR